MREGLGMKQLIEQAQALQEDIVADRRWLHRHAECGFQLPETTAYVKKRLEEMGYSVEEICECGLSTTVGDPARGKCILLRADMDALPIEEETDLDFASTNGNMHACGHDTHAAMLLGVARLLKPLEDQLAGCVKFVFQPNEEGSATSDITGGDAILAGGILENPSVDAVAAVHLMPHEMRRGQVVTRKGTSFSSVDDIEIIVTGFSSHGSMPQSGIDPINIACHLYLGLQNIIARELDAAEQCVATIGLIEGGSAANVIPGTVRMLGTLRAASEDVRQRFKDCAYRMVPALAAAFGGQAEIAFLRGAPSTYNDPQLTDTLVRYTEELFDEPVEFMARPFSGSDDLGVLSHEVPTTYFLMGTGIPEEGCEYPVHNSKVVFDESVFWKGAALLANCAVEYLADCAQ